jgi:hypothetical protein
LGERAPFNYQMEYVGVGKRSSKGNAVFGA